MIDPKLHGLRVFYKSPKDYREYEGILVGSTMKRHDRGFGWGLAEATYFIMQANGEVVEAIGIRFAKVSDVIQALTTR